MTQQEVEAIHRLTETLATAATKLAEISVTVGTARGTIQQLATRLVNAEAEVQQRAEADRQVDQAKADRNQKLKEKKADKKKAQATKTALHAAWANPSPEAK